MYSLGTTRFNSKTWLEHERWKINNNYTGAIYTTPIKIKDKVPLGIYIFVLEMDNDKNKIKGIGLIKNKIDTENEYNIYNDRNYNRYGYISKYHIYRHELSLEEKKIIRILDTLVFKGEMHLKRGQGITLVPKWIENNKHINFIEILKNMFKLRYENK